MFLRLHNLATLLLLLLLLPLGAAETDHEDQTQATAEPVEELQLDFSDLEDCHQINQGWFWGKEDPSYQLIARSERRATVSTAIGPVAVDNSLFAADADSSTWRSSLQQLITVAAAAEIDASTTTVRYSDSAITGPRLTSPSHVVIPEAVLTKAASGEYEAPEKIAALEDAASALSLKLNDYKKLNKLGRASIRHILERIHWSPERPIDHDAVPPDFARMVVRHGWLHSILGDDAAVQTVSEAVAAVQAYRPTRSYTSEQASLHLMKNAYGESSWLLQTPKRTVYTCAAPEPDYHYQKDEFSEQVWLIVELPGGVDPLDLDADLRQIRRLQLQDRKTEKIIASWDGEQFTSDNDVWRLYLDTRGRNRIDDFVPPHITQVSLYGDIVKIVTPNGVLDALQETSPSETERFLQNAAEVLTTPAYLDLIGQYMLTYVYDSPDSSIPFLIGNSENSSDIHQTALQTLQTSCGGHFRGDCDDLSELYHNILSRQGKTPHVVSLPAHAAVAWAEEQSGKWHTYVLQTGPALEFVDSSLQKSLEKSYKHFDEGDTFDPNGLGLLLRFSGENTRSSWRLSYRIFSEPDYAQTMIDVQRDWHFQTYQRAIHKMLKMIADGDEDTANYRELSGLYNFTGQYEKAAEYHQMAIDRTKEESSKLFMGMELVQHLFRAGQKEKAVAVAQDIYDRQLPALKNDLRGSELQFALQMASTLTSDGEYDLALDYLDTYTGEAMDSSIGRMVNFINSDTFDQRNWARAHSLRRLVKWYINTAIPLVRERGFDDIDSNPSLVKVMKHIEMWIREIAPHEIEEPEDVPGTYAVIANTYLISLGIEEMISKTQAAAVPQHTDYDHSLRLSGLPQLKRDLPWIKISVPFWWLRMAEQFEYNRSVELDRDLLNNCYQLAETAYQHSNTMGLAGAFTRKQIHYARLVHALINKDAAQIRELLQYVKSKNDKRLRDDTAQWIGDCARDMSLDWFEKVIDLWVEELDYKPKYYWIAWRAALNHAPQHALIVARRAAARFKDDPAFVEEYEFMQELFGSQ